MKIALCPVDGVLPVIRIGIDNYFPNSKKNNIVLIAECERCGEQAYCGSASNVRDALELWNSEYRQSGSVDIDLDDKLLSIELHDDMSESELDELNDLLRTAK